MTRGRRAILVLTFACLVAPASAQTPDEGEGKAWQFSAYVDAYFPADDPAYGVPTVFANRGSLHLEARYNYEDFDTGSLLAGWTFRFGREKKYLNLTPTIGGFFGNSNGFAPGLEIEAHWGRLAYWLESEYAIHPGDSESNYFYSWSELNLFLFPKLWVGGSLQRLKSVDSPREVDVGPMVGFGSAGKRGAAVSFYVYGIGSSSTSYLATLSMYF
jgi:hypothetical protein